MSKMKLTNEELSTLCMELSLLLHAGLDIDDGLHSLIEDSDAEMGALLSEMAEHTGRGEPLSAAMRGCGAFPDDVCTLTEVGERTGRPEEALRALSESYDARERLSQRIRAALLYPSVLMLLMLLVIGILLIKVLPVFNEVFQSLGGELTGLAGGLLTLGGALDAALPAVLAILAAAAAFLTAFAVSDRVRERLTASWRSRRGDRGIFRKIATARFAQALSMGLRSGLPVEESLRLAASFHGENEAVTRRYREAETRIARGTGMAEALRDAGVLPPSYCRMLMLGVRSGTADTVITEIARRLSEDSENAIEAKVSRVEPAMVIAASLLVGVILLSVMLPLMDIMSTIG